MKVRAALALLLLISAIPLCSQSLPSLKPPLTAKQAKEEATREAKLRKAQEKLDAEQAKQQAKLEQEEAYRQWALSPEGIAQLEAEREAERERVHQDQLESQRRQQQMHHDMVQSINDWPHHRGTDCTSNRIGTTIYTHCE